MGWVCFRERRMQTLEMEILERENLISPTTEVPRTEKVLEKEGRKMWWRHHHHPMRMLKL